MKQLLVPTLLILAATLNAQSFKHFKTSYSSERYVLEYIFEEYDFGKNKGYEFYPSKPIDIVIEVNTLAKRYLSSTLEKLKEKNGEIYMKCFFKTNGEMISFNFQIKKKIIQCILEDELLEFINAFNNQLNILDYVHFENQKSPGYSIYNFPIPQRNRQNTK